MSIGSDSTSDNANSAGDSANGSDDSVNATKGSITSTNDSKNNTNESINGTNDSDSNNNESINGTNDTDSNNNENITESNGPETNNEDNENIQYESSITDSYISSDEEPPSTSFQYLSNSLDYGLDSLELDKSLVLQAQLSGVLNNETQKIAEKTRLLKEKLDTLQKLYIKTFPKVDQMTQDIKLIEQRLKVLKYGERKLLFKKPGILQRYPVEYNRARDKVLERQLDE